jgi:arylsulfatase A-like enzyme
MCCILRFSFIPTLVPVIRRLALITSALLMGLTSSSVTLTAGSSPNFVFILADDFGWKDTGFNGSPFYETPHLDRLARTGMSFTSGYAASTVCSPTRYSILTGRYPVRVGATDWFSGTRSGRFKPAPLNNRMPLAEVTLAEALKEHGYRTAFLGKWHLGPNPEHWPENQGFDINYGGWTVGSPRGGYFAPFENPRLPDVPEGAHLPKVLTDETLRILKEFKDSQFLVYLSFYSVHTPLQGREDLVAKYEAKRKHVPEADSSPEFGPEEQVWPTDKIRRVRLRQCHAVYGAMIEAMDEQIGRILDQLDTLGLADNTVVCFMSDNGGLSTSEGSPTSNLPLRGGKGWLYEGGIREPFLIRWPGVTPPSSLCTTPVMSTDFYPTILDIAGIPLKPEQHQDGTSLAPLLKGQGRFPDRTLFWHYPHYSNQGGFPGGALRTGNWKLIERYEDGRIHLFNIATDLGEQNDVAQQHPDLVRELRGKLHAWYKETGAKFLEPKTGSPPPWRPSLH